MSDLASLWRRTVSAVAIVAALAAAGCELLVDPFTDEWADAGEVTTPSAERARAAEVSQTVLQRPHTRKVVRPEEGPVTHGPLAFEDPYEETGSDDGRYAWTYEDLLYEFYGPGRFIVNGLFLPVSAVVTPPWTVMVSDGRPSREVAGHAHDAVARGDDGGPPSTAPDDSPVE